jgi:selenocysteine lyase/cysteine desulfurase
MGAIEHVAWLGTSSGGVSEDAPLRERLRAGWAASQAHERALMKVFLEGLAAIPGAKLYGLSGANELADRVPTFSFTVPGRTAREVVAHLAGKNIFCWAGSFYAHEAAHHLGIQQHGVVRIGLAHYTGEAEVRRALAEVEACGGTA